VKGLGTQSKLAAEKLVADKKQPMDIINQYIVPALNYVGDLFREKRNCSCRNF
jgi:5-methyltetrahydrofolate--homocysteine methyltransferase